MVFHQQSFSGGLVVISGNAPSYRGHLLRLQACNDYLTGIETLLAETSVDEDGNFGFSINLEKVCRLSIKLGIYKGLLFAEPGKNYQLILPPWADKNQAQLLNPYFKPDEIYLGINNKDQNNLNDLLRGFDDHYDSLMSETILAIAYKRTVKHTVDSILAAFDRPYQPVGNSFFLDYRTYRYAYIRLILTIGGNQKIIRDYFLNKPVLYENPAYMDLFNEVYKNAEISQGEVADSTKMTDGKAANKTYNAILASMPGNHSAGNNELKEIVLLKELFNSYYEKNFPPFRLVELLDSTIVQTRNPRIKIIAGNFRDKVTALMVGYDAPLFELLDRDNQHVKLIDLRGKYVYLNFCTFSNLPCLEEFGLLNKLNHDHSDQIEIVTVICEGDYKNFTSELLKKDYNWTFLFYGNNQDIMKQYQVLTFPTYYLIDPYGKLVLVPAPSPREDFETHFYNVLKKRNN
ncbi:MAG: TlpA disulfide reductase family protein [Bacteroidia bacterium]|nr:TlpA disulfide reductase family protein [Bacteroidia bacterium]